MSRRFQSSASSLARRTLPAVINCPITIFAWVKIPDWDGVSNRTIVAIGESYGSTLDNSIWLWNQAAADRIVATARDTAGEGNSTLNFTADSGDGVWVPVMGTYTSSTSRLVRAFSPRQNGSASTASRATDDVLDEIIIGRAAQGGYVTPDAYIAEVAVWTTALGDTEYDQLVTGSSAGLSPKLVSSGSLIGYWSFASDTGGSSVPDESGNSNDLTLTGTVSYSSDHPTIDYGSTKYMKYFIQSTAVGAEVDGIVFQPGSGGSITGLKIGEFTGIEVVAGTGDDTGKGVLLVPAADFNGSGLAVDAEVVALARTSTFTTGIEPGVIVEE